VNWPAVKVREIATAHYGKALKRENRDESGSFEVFGSSGSVGQHSEPLVKHPTLVVGRKGSVGEVIWAPNGGWIIDTAYFLELKDTEVIDLRYLYYALKRAKLDRRTITTSIPGLNRDDLYDSEVPLPPIKEQKRIATILDKADNICRKRQQAIQLADEFLRAVFLDMFGDIPAKKSPFELKGCRGAVSAASGKSSKAVFSDQTTEIPIYGGNGINGYATKALYDEPVIVVGRVGQQCAITHLTSGPSWVTDNAIVVKIVDKQQFNPVYLAHAFKNSPIRNVVTRLDLPFVNQAMILDHPIPHPPIELQNKYADIHKKVLRTVDGLNKSADDSLTNFSSLAQKAFTGQL